MIFSGAIKQYLIRKLQEPTTWAGIVTAVATATGWNAPPATQQAIVTVATAVVSLLLVLTNESRKPSGGPLGIAPPSTAAGDDPPGTVERVPEPANAPAVGGDRVSSQPRTGIRPVQDKPIGPG